MANRLDLNQYQLSHLPSMTLRLGWMSSCHPARHEAEHINSIQTANIADSNGLGVAIFLLFRQIKNQRLRFLPISISTVSASIHWRVICTLAATWKGKKICFKFFETISPTKMAVVFLFMGSVRAWSTSIRGHVGRGLSSTPLMSSKFNDRMDSAEQRPHKTRWVSKTRAGKRSSVYN